MTLYILKSHMEFPKNIYLEKELSSEQNSNSFLDPAVAVADIDTFFAAETQIVNII